MPTYEYKCLKCGLRFDVIQSMQDAPLKKCKECHGKVKRLIGSGAGIIFKGSGFYCTDYRSDSYKQSATKDTSTVSSPAPSSAAKAPGSASSAKATESSPAKA